MDAKLPTGIAVIFPKDPKCPNTMDGRGEYLGVDAYDQTMAYTRDIDTDLCFCVPLSHVEYDRSEHYDSSVPSDSLCQCGHPYHRHFDGYEQDDYFPNLPAYVGCKYCTCRKFVPSTIENQINRLHDHRLYTIKITRNVSCNQLVKGRMFGSSLLEVSLLQGMILQKVRLIHHDEKTVFVEGILLDKPIKISDLPTDSFEVIERGWECPEDTHDDLELEQYQPEHLRLR